MDEQDELEALATQKDLFHDPEVKQLRQLWEGSQGWRAPLGEEPDLEQLQAQEDLHITPRGDRTLITDTRPLEEVNPTLAQMFEDMAAEFPSTMTYKGCKP